MTEKSHRLRWPGSKPVAGGMMGLDRGFRAGSRFADSFPDTMMKDISW